jgi:hypothetical protein
VATAISSENFKAALGEVYDALAAENWSEAYRWLSLADAQLAGLAASSQIDGAAITRRQSLEALRKAVDAAKARSAGSRFEIQSRWVP